jgi:anti-anti-sigma regulatory factor
VIVEGTIGPRAGIEFEDRLERIVDSDHEYVLIDLHRCRSIDAVAVKQLVVARQLLSYRRREMLIFGAEGEVRGILEDVGAFDCDPALHTVPGVRRIGGRGAAPPADISHRASWHRSSRACARAGDP